MRLTWIIDEADVRYVHEFVSAWSADEFVKLRYQRNLGEPRPRVTRDAIWMALAGCLLTTQQRSGPGTPVHRFLELTPFPLGYGVCKLRVDLEAYARSQFLGFGGIRRWTIIPQQLKANLERLEAGLWGEVLDIVEGLNATHEPSAERQVAHFLDKALQGLGPKQSRNLLQWVGVGRYEIPIDSRITKWLNRHLLTFTLSANMLSDEAYYDMVSDGIQALCERVGVYPCILDAAVFASYDKVAWNSSNLGSESLSGA